MENFFIDEDFYTDIEDYLAYLEFEQENVEALPDNFEQETELSTLEPVCEIDADWLFETIIEQIIDNHEDRISADDGALEKVEEKIKVALQASINIDKINEWMPKYYYPNGTKGKITKQDLLDYFK
jgi:DNA replication initiation complex subunit (GINS family)